MSEVYFFQIKYEKIKARFAYGFIDIVLYPLNVTLNKALAKQFICLIVLYKVQSCQLKKY